MLRLYKILTSYRTMKILCVIPSRLNSTRLPQKPLLPIQGKPMIQWVYENARRCPLITKLVVATDDVKVSNLITQLGGEAMLTSPDLPSGSDRVAAVAANYPEIDIVINLQGDEPFIKPEMLTQLVAPYLAGDTPEMTTLAYPLDKKKHFNSANVVKVITDINQNAIYFSRAPIPYHRNTHEGSTVPVYHHMGLYAFRKDFLTVYQQLPQTPLEQIESLEQLRALENGYRIRVCLTEHRTLEINTPEEYEQAQSFPF